MKPASQGQFVFDLAHKVSFAPEDFLVVPGNTQAVAWLERWPQWPGSGLILCGPEGAGKSHLVSIWQQRSQARSLTPAEIMKDRELAGKIKRATSYLIEDADQIEGAQGERMLLHFYNWVVEHRGSVVMTARTPLADWRLNLPDLSSRLKALPQVSIAPPDDEMLALVLVKLFSDRQLRVSEEVLTYILPRIERTPRAAAQVVDALDRASLQVGRRITVSLVREVLVKKSKD